MQERMTYAIYEIHLSSVAFKWYLYFKTTRKVKGERTVDYPTACLQIWEIELAPYRFFIFTHDES